MPNKKNIKMPMNPLSIFWVDEKGNRVSESVARIAKIAAFSNDVYKKQAIDSKGNMITLGEKGATEDKVDFIGGMWRIQSDFPYKITQVRDKQMVLLDNMNRVETTLFDFWTAKLVGYNCYGPFVTADKGYDYIVAVYDTDNGKLLGYGKTIEAARAFLGLKLYDEHKDVINSIVCRNKLKGKHK